MEAYAVVVSLFYELDEVVPVFGSLAVEFHSHCALVRDDVEFRLFNQFVYHAVCN